MPELGEDVGVFNEVVEDVGEGCCRGVGAGYYYQAAVADEPSWIFVNWVGGLFLGIY